MNLQLVLSPQNPELTENNPIKVYEEVIGKTNVMFKMKETILNKIKESGTYPEQRQLLKEFYEEVMTAIKKLN